MTNTDPQPLEYYSQTLLVFVFVVGVSVFTMAFYVPAAALNVLYVGKLALAWLVANHVYLVALPPKWFSPAHGKQGTLILLSAVLIGTPLYLMATPDHEADRIDYLMLIGLGICVALTPFLSKR